MFTLVTLSLSSCEWEECGCSVLTIIVSTVLLVVVAVFVLHDGWQSGVAHVAGGGAVN